ncbi:putative tricarboxylate transport protein, mitochondrial isoform X2 [Musca autumnalis]
MNNEQGQLNSSAGVCEAIFAVTPMETIKVKFINNPQYKGFAHWVGCIIKAAGIGGIYKGLTATVLKQGSNQAIRFYVLLSLKDFIREITTISQYQNLLWVFLVPLLALLRFSLHITVYQKTRNAQTHIRDGRQ